jgi:cytochrome c oxidase subunit 2
MSRWLPAPASAHAGQIDLVLTLVHLLMLALFVGWSVYLVVVLFRFRRSRNPHADHVGTRGRFALGTEIAVVAAEVLLLFLIALPLWYTRTSARPAETGAVVLRVVAEQFAWNVHYPGADGKFGATTLALVSPANPIGLDRGSEFGKDDVVELSAIHLPVNRPVIIQLSSKDVIHSFGVPAMRVKQDAVPGLFTPVWFTPTRAGDFEIACSQLCGIGHYRMRGVITVESEEVFRKWLADEAAAQR